VGSPSREPAANARFLYSSDVTASTAEPGFRSLGQPIARRLARVARERHGFAQTLLVHGPRGAGTDAFVDDLLALAFCTDPDGDRRPCNACRGCRDGRARSHPDLVIGSPESWREGRSTGESIVASARRWLLGAAGSPVQAARRVVLVERADRASEPIQNALLKALEEPSDRHVFVLVAEEPSGLLPTIRSRAQPLRIGPVRRSELVAHLMDVERLPEDLADALARISGGLAGTAVAFARDRALLDWRRRVQLHFVDLLERGRAERFAVARELLDDTVGLVPQRAAEDDEVRTPASVQREAALLLVDAWIGIARDLLVAGAGRPDLTPGGELEPRLTDLGRRIGVAPLVAHLERLEAIHDGLRENAAPRLALEAGMLSWPFLAPDGDGPGGHAR
jgi:DNA polymerase III delta prime subunit